MTKQPSILFVTASLPEGPCFGGMLRTKGVLGELRRIGRVTVAVVPRKCPDESLLKKARESLGDVRVLPLKGKSVSGLRDRIRHEFSHEYVNS